MAKGVTESVNEPIVKLPILTSEQIKVETAFVEPISLEESQPPLVHQVIGTTAAKDPQATAVFGQGDTISYGELNRKANQLAHYLLSQHVKKGDLIGIAVKPSHHALVSLLGVLKAGAIGMFLDSDKERLKNGGVGYRFFFIYLYTRT